MYICLQNIYTGIQVPFESSGLMRGAGKGGHTRAQDKKGVQNEVTGKYFYIFK